MSFLNPLGLLGLIGIPILILIYIIKSKYQEHSVSSTFLWTLSEKFLTKKTPFSRFSGLLTLILQILTVLFLSLALANPLITLPNYAKNYVLIVDNSASMNISSRFENSKNEMKKLVNDAKKGSKFTIVLAGSDASVIIENQEDKEKVLQSIDLLNVSQVSSSISNGLSIAQSYFDNDNSLNVYLYSDIFYENNQNIEVVNVSDIQDYNASINSLYQVSNETNLIFKGEVISYNKDADLILNLLLDDKVVETINVSCLKDESTMFTIETDLKTFNEAKVVITNQDSLVLDNEYIYYSSSNMDSYNVLLVSGQPFYLQSLLKVFNNINLTVSSNLSASSGYDLYIYDSLMPSSLPTDGAIWLFNPKTNITNAGFACQAVLEVDTGAILEKELKNQNNNIYKTLTNGLTGNQISVKEFNIYSLVSNFTTIMSYENYPMIFAGINNNNNRQVVFSFDLHNSNLPLLLDYIIMVNNSLNYLLPSLCEQSVFTSGDDLNINVLANLNEVRINTPSNYSTYLTLNDSIATYKLDEIGIYTINAKINDTIKEYKIFVSFPKNEQNPINKQESIEILGNKTNVSYNSTMEINWLFFIIVLVLCLVEWEVYVYEQRNIR